MKKTFRMVMGALMTLVLALPLASCSDDNDGDDTPAEVKVSDLHGTWVHTETDNTMYVYTFNDDNTGYLRQVKNGANEGEEIVTEKAMTYALAGLDTFGDQTLTITTAATETEEAKAYTYEVAIDNGVLYIDGDAFVKATTDCKELLGSWVAQYKDNEGQANEIVYTDTYTFEKNGKGKAQFITFYASTAKTETDDVDFTYVVNPEGNGNFQVLVLKWKDNGSIASYKLKIEGDALYLDNRVYTKKQ